MMKDTDWPTLCEGICFGLNRDAFGGPSFQGDGRGRSSRKAGRPDLDRPQPYGPVMGA
jgi:hypothetical protein